MGVYAKPSYTIGFAARAFANLIFRTKPRIPGFRPPITVNSLVSYIRCQLDNFRFDVLAGWREEKRGDFWKKH